MEQSVSLADARCCGITTVTWTFLYLNGVFFSINFFNGLNCKNLSHIWIWNEQKQYWFSMYVQIISVAQGCYSSQIWSASWVTVNKNFQYDLLAWPKCKAALNHGCYCPHLTPVSRVLQNLPLVCNWTHSELLTALWHSPWLASGGSYAKVNTSITCWAGRENPRQIWNQVCTHMHELASFSKGLAILSIRTAATFIKELSLE